MIVTSADTGQEKLSALILIVFLPDFRDVLEGVSASYFRPLFLFP